MMRKTGRVLAVLGALALAACANTEATLRNAKGESRYCYLVYGIGGERTTVVDRFNKCLNDAGAEGFRRVEPRPAVTRVVEIPPSF